MTDYLMLAGIAATFTVLAVLSLHYWQDTKRKTWIGITAAFAVLACVTWAAAFAVSEPFKEGAGIAAVYHGLSTSTK